MGGLVHYYNPILSAINQFDGYELATLTPAQKGSSLGKGVHEEKGEFGFQQFHLEEQKGLFRKPFFKSFQSVLDNYKPSIIIAGWPYSLEILLNPLIKLHGAKVIHKDIPFNLPLYKNAWTDYRSGKIIVSEDYQKSDPSDLMGALKYRFITQLRKAFLSKADALVCYTEDALRLFPSYGVSEDRIFIIYNSPWTPKLIEARNAAHSMPAILDDHPRRLIHVGRLVKWKKVDLIMQAMAMLPEEYQDTELVVVGDGPEREHLELLAESMGLKNRVIFKGSIYDPKELARLHLDSSVYVLGGIGGLSINEAMSFGKPVLCSEADGTERMLVKEGVNGYYFESDNADDLKAKIVLLFSKDQNELKAFGVASCRIIAEEINEKRVLAGYKKALDFTSH